MPRRIKNGREASEVRSPHGCLYGDAFIQSAAAADEDMRTIRFTRFFATHIFIEAILWLCIRFAPVSRFLSRIPVRPSAETVNFRKFENLKTICDILECTPNDLFEEYYRPKQD